MEFYASIKKNKITSFAEKWRALENIMLSDISQSQRVKSPMFSLICGSQGEWDLEGTPDKEGENFS